MPVPPRRNPADDNWLFPFVRPDPPARVFELGLVLGGTVSAGAYTAGALDFLLQALEAWHDGQPPHSISIPIVAGASGGAINSGMLSLLARKRIPHIDPSQTNWNDTPGVTGNPLWDIWVDHVDGRNFLTTDDIGNGKLLSILNTGLIDSAATQIAALGREADGFDRPYFPAPFRLAVTLANLRGIPYVMDVPATHGWRGPSFRAHDDFARFAVAHGADPQSPDPAVRKRPDEFWVDATGQGGDWVDATTLAEYCVASAAFPVGLRARPLSRPLHHYLYRPRLRLRPTVDRAGTVTAGLERDWPEPDWSEIMQNTPDRYDFVSVDGGTFNNDPVRLVHEALAGLAGSDPREPDTARRAIFMIDPLAGRDSQLPVPPEDLIGILSPLVTSLTDTGRYYTADMALLGDPNVFSRFQLVPARADMNRTGDTALAGSWLEAFGGFLCRPFRVHDFMLGRLNMQNYLRTTLVLQGDNPLFGNWSADDRKRFAVDGAGNRVNQNGGVAPSAYMLPVIPDRSYAGDGPIACEPTPQTLPWPYKALDPESLRGAIDTRVKAVLSGLEGQELGGAGGFFFNWLIEPVLQSDATGKLVDLMRAELIRVGLWPSS
jgi:hypothetical protein